LSKIGIAKADSQSEVDEISHSELDAFFGDAKYPEKFQTYQQKGSRFAGFSFWAALYGTAWFFYRRLYVQGLGLLFVEVLFPTIVSVLTLAAVPQLTERADGLVLFASIVGTRIATGYWGNLVLFKKAERQIREIDTMNFNNDMHLRMITGAGAVNIPAFLVSFGIIGILDRIFWFGLV
jgi:hypothetical protein